MSAENLFTTSRIENVNQIIAELYDDSILLEKRMESFFLNLNNIVFFEKANFCFTKSRDRITKPIPSTPSTGMMNRNGGIRKNTAIWMMFCRFWTPTAM